MIFISLVIFVQSVVFALTNLDNTSTVYVRPGGEEITALTTNPSTGFTWKVQNFQSVEFNIEDLGVVKATSNVVGAPTTQRYKITAISDALEGDQIGVILQYLQPWPGGLVGIVKEITIVATNDPQLLGD